MLAHTSSKLYICLIFKKYIKNTFNLFLETNTLHKRETEILSKLNKGTPQIGPSSSRKTWGLEVLLDSH